MHKIKLLNYYNPAGGYKYETNLFQGKMNLLLLHVIFKIAHNKRFYAIISSWFQLCLIYSLSGTGINTELV